MKRKHKRISKQKFYEKCIMKTYEHALGPIVENELKMMNYEVPDNFEQLMMKRDIFGFKTKIPHEHPFDKLGFEYLKQLFGMSLFIKDDDFRTELFDFVNTHRSLFDFHSQEQLDFLAGFFYESVTGEFGSREYCSNMGDFILSNFDKSLEGIDKIFSTTYALATTSLEMDELMKIKREIYRKTIDNDNTEEYNSGHE